MDKKFIQNRDETTSTVRNMDHMLRDLDKLNEAEKSSIQTKHGWKRSIASGIGYRHDYHHDIAEGGWEFYTLGNGIYLITVDMKVVTDLPIRHSSHDHLVLSAVINAGVDLYDQSGPIGELADGYCTYYGLSADEEFNTIYRPDKKLQWVSVFIDRTQLYDTLGITAEDIPSKMKSFIEEGGHLPHANIILSPTAFLTAQQLLECPFSGGYKKAFLKAKSQELACHILFMLSNDVDEEINDATFTDADYKKIYRAMRYLKNDLDEPVNIPEIAYAVGMTRQKLQMGFKMVFGNTVAKIRDNLRMEHALTLVRRSDMSMIEIAIETGYEHPASFTRAFKAAYNTTPANMRKMHQQDTYLSKISKE